MSISRRDLRHYLESIGVAIAGLMAVVLHFLGMLPRERIWELTLSIVCVLAIIALLEFKATSEEHGELTSEVRSIRAAVDEVMEALETGINLVKCPEDPDAYIKLWAGYQETYYAYNPSYTIEDFPGLVANRQRIIESVFVARYRNPSLQNACYLFLTADKKGQDDLKKFCKLMEEVTAAGCREVETKLEVRQLTGVAAEEHSEFYLGVKHGRQTSILEPKELALSRGHGEPYVYLEVTSGDVNQKLRQHFNDMWKVAQNVKLF